MQRITAVVVVFGLVFSVAAQQKKGKQSPKRDTSGLSEKAKRFLERSDKEREREIARLEKETKERSPKQKRTKAERDALRDASAKRAKRLAELRDPETIVVPPLDLIEPSIGDIGKLITHVYNFANISGIEQAYSLYVFKLVSPDEVIVRSTISTYDTLRGGRPYQESGQLFLIRVPAEGMATDKAFQDDKRVFEIIGTQTFGTYTMHVLQPIDLKELLKTDGNAGKPRN